MLILDQCQVHWYSTDPTDFLKLTVSCEPFEKGRWLIGIYTQKVHMWEVRQGHWHSTDPTDFLKLDLTFEPLEKGCKSLVSGYLGPEGRNWALKLCQWVYLNKSVKSDWSLEFTNTTDFLKVVVTFEPLLIGRWILVSWYFCPKGNKLEVSGVHWHSTGPTDNLKVAVTFEL